MIAARHRRQARLARGLFVWVARMGAAASARLMAAHGARRALRRPLREWRMQAAVRRAESGMVARAARFALRAPLHGWHERAGTLRGASRRAAEVARRAARFALRAPLHGWHERAGTLRGASRRAAEVARRALRRHLLRWRVRAAVLKAGAMKAREVELLAQTLTMREPAPRPTAKQTVGRAFEHWRGATSAEALPPVLRQLLRARRRLQSADTVQASEAQQRQAWLLTAVPGTHTSPLKRPLGRPPHFFV